MTATAPVGAPDPALDWMRPDFSADRVRALMTTRPGGASVGQFQGLNLREGLGDDASAVQRNRQRVELACGVPIRRLQQVHGVQVQHVESAAEASQPWPQADASVTAAVGVACEIQVADCLPVLLADRQGRVVGAAHAGWRGLAGGVLEATLAQVCRLSGARAHEVEVWLGPCIGPTAFEVGEDVLVAFGASATQPGAYFRGVQPSDPRRHGEHARWWGDLPGLARERLRAAGVTALSGNDGTLPWCTWSDPSRYFSFRRDGVTGRMAALIWRQP
jgi:polyphenol oxidase